MNVSNQPKRHHWWPMAQSQHWTDADGLVFASRSNGTYFRANPLNIGVESELYTRFGSDNSKDTSIEDWFANTIDSPVTQIFKHLFDPSNITRQSFDPDPMKAKSAKEIGYKINSYIDKISLPSNIRAAISAYLAALLVRHPTYLSKLINFHNDGSNPRETVKDIALDNMLELFELYYQKIRSAVFIVSRRIGTSEFLYADGGILVDEPWRREFGIPFDIHAPLTPDIAIQVLPIPDHGELSYAFIAESTNQGVSRQNKIILGGAQRFVFSRQPPPSTFIQRHFGVPAPKNIGYSFINGQLNTTYDPSRK
ncbi:hypothetical protein GETHED_21050 [Geothrix edaphica]|uniref:DUF4238 domain-containing protein n=1 Tax=Geothrix edaphica TaxID=2927976 RepID=A0ABQ5PZD3_9BACT|nr:hypothetical protein GETHED_21050 [Geothrix edaphica]